MRPRARRRRRLAVAAFGTALLVAVTAAPDARAHEFALALVSAPAQGDATGRDVVDGFRLAVDESPDVSHPPGEEAGDHLGGVDVDLEVVEVADGRASGVADAVAAGASVVVVLGTSPDAAVAVARELDGTGVLVVDAGPEPPASPPGTAGLLRLRDRPGGSGGAASPAATRFSGAFERRFGRPGTDWAARGYDAGRLLDVSLRQLGADSRDVEALAAAANASGQLVRSTVVVAAAPRSQPPTGGARSQPLAPGNPLPPATALTLLAGGGAAASGAALLAVAAVRRRRARGQPGIRWPGR